jgi:hypothetical protein
MWKRYNVKVSLSAGTVDPNLNTFTVSRVRKGILNAARPLAMCLLATQQQFEDWD